MITSLSPILVFCLVCLSISAKASFLASILTRLSKNPPGLCSSLIIASVTGLIANPIATGPNRADKPAAPPTLVKNDKPPLPLDNANKLGMFFGSIPAFFYTPCASSFDIFFDNPVIGLDLLG